MGYRRYIVPFIISRENTLLDLCRELKSINQRGVCWRLMLWTLKCFSHVAIKYSSPEDKERENTSFVEYLLRKIAFNGFETSKNINPVPVATIRCFMVFLGSIAWILSEFPWGHTLEAAVANATDRMWEREWYWWGSLNNWETPESCRQQGESVLYLADSDWSWWLGCLDSKWQCNKPNILKINAEFWLGSLFPSRFWSENTNLCLLLMTACFTSTKGTWRASKVTQAEKGPIKESRHLTETE